MVKKKRIPQIRKDLKDFLISEEGKITKKDITKVGLSLIAISMMVTPESAYPQTHTNMFFSSAGGSGHNSHTSHSSHGSHGSHSNAVAAAVTVVVGVTVTAGVVTVA
ncbi:MAG: hypothetical protein C4533_07125 [Candidatus Omnitrophota bacterium]|jgi:hypothetical protein|nr:MAG: hypothetical protein C4533_07125 [Candidatus Omnitrophota bacterium]